MHAYIHTYMHTYMRTYIHTYIRLHVEYVYKITHTDTHMCVCFIGIYVYTRIGIVPESPTLQTLDPEILSPKTQHTQQ